MNLVLFLTNQCNLRCNYCFVNKNKKVLSFDTYKKVLKENAEKINQITFFGGEPLLCFDMIKKIIEYNEKNNIKVAYVINTNALLLNNEIIQYCKLKNILLNVSLDGNMKSNVLNRCDEKQFELILNNIVNAINNHVKVIANYVVTPNNIKYYYDGIKFMVENNIKEICLMVNYGAVWKKKDIDIFKEENDKVIQYINDLNDKIIIHPLQSKITALIGNVMIKKCNFGNDNIISNTDGELFPCIEFLNNKDYKITRKKDKFKNITNIKKCLNCNYNKYCVNNCMCKHISLNSKSEVDANCEFEKIFINSATKIVINRIDKVLD